MSSEVRYLRWHDYFVFGLVLTVSASIGIVFAVRGRRHTSPEEYLLASKQLTVLPVALSLLASFMSAITLLGTPAEIYSFGTQYIWIGVSYLFVILLSCELTLPVFHRMRVHTANEYLRLRFHRANQIAGSISFIVQMVMYMGIVIYAPSLALSAVTGFNVWAAVACIGVVATFYTTIGGIKAVVWTDVFQVCIMFAGLVISLVKGLIDFGGPAAVWQMLIDGGRVEFLNMSPLPIVRHTVWTQVVGNTFVWLAIYGINQTMVQRCLSLKSMREIRLAYWLNFPGLVLLMLICSACGAVIFAAYRHCDPISAGRISATDQLLPLYVMDYLSNLPIVPGIFVASIFSGALSTVSSGVNSLAAVTLTDVLQPCVVNFTEKQKTWLCKLLALLYGMLSLGFAIVASQLGSVLQAALGLFGMIGGPLLGVFSLGVLFPIANWKGALVGHAVSQLLVFWIGVGSYVYGVQADRLPVTTANCTLSASTADANTSTAAAAVASSASTVERAIVNQESIPDFYKISYTWYSLLGCVVAIVVGLIVSCLTRDKKAEEQLSRNLFAPIVRRRMPRRPDDDDDVGESVNE